MSGLDASRLEGASQSRRHVGRRVIVLAETESTNDVAHDAAKNPDEIGLAVFAERQSAGRGRMGRSWSAPPGSSLLFSILIEPPPALADAPFLIAWSASSLASVLRDQFSLAARVKWPNDILIDGRKVCGIMVERRIGTVIGIGLNVNVPADAFPDELHLPATSLLIETGRTVDRSELAAALLDRLDADYAQALEQGRGATLARWGEVAEDWRGQPVSAKTLHGDEVGILLYLDPDRGALLATDGGATLAIPPQELLRIEPTTRRVVGK